jgi:hypothetical protein
MLSHTPFTWPVGQSSTKIHPAKCGVECVGGDADVCHG